MSIDVFLNSTPSSGIDEWLRPSAIYTCMIVRLKQPVNRPFRIAAAGVVLIAIAVFVAPGVATGQVGQGLGLLGGIAATGIMAWLAVPLMLLNALGFMLFSLVLAVFLAMIQLDITQFMGTGQAVDTVWRLLRDLSNMFFIIVLMAIAFGTMLKVESYKWQRMIPKLALMAILINFSKTIALIILDVAHLLMMTFVNAFKDIAVDNIITATRITEPFTNLKSIIATDGGNAAMTALIGEIMTTIMIYAVVLVLDVILLLIVFRMVFLWIFIAISPVAYVTNIIDSTQKYAQKWWNMYIKLVLFGPMLAFFLWFALMFMAGGSGVLPEGALEKAAPGTKGSYGGVGDSQNFANFLIGTILLVVGTGMAVSSADYGGKAAGKVFDAGKKKGQAFAGRFSQKGYGALPGAQFIKSRFGAESKFAETGFGKAFHAKYQGVKGGVKKLAEDNKYGRVFGGLAKVIQNKLQLAVALTVPEARKQFFAQRDEKRRLEDIMGAEGIAKAGAIDTYGVSNILRTLQTNFSGADTEAQKLSKDAIDITEELNTSPLELGKAAIKDENKALDGEIGEQKKIQDQAIASLTNALKTLDATLTAQDAKDVLLSGDPHKAINDLETSKGPFDSGKKSTVITNGWNLLPSFLDAKTKQEEGKELQDKNVAMLANTDDPTNRAEIIKKGQGVAKQKAEDLGKLQAQLTPGFVFDTKELTRRQDKLNELTAIELTLLRQLADPAPKSKKEMDALREDMKKNHNALRQLGYGSKMNTQLDDLKSEVDAGTIAEAHIDGFAKFAKVELPQATKEQLLAAQLEGKSAGDILGDYTALESISTSIDPDVTPVQKLIAQEKMREKALLLQTIAKTLAQSGGTSIVNIGSDGLIATSSDTTNLETEWDTRKSERVTKEYFKEDEKNFADSEHGAAYKERKKKREETVAKDKGHYDTAADPRTKEGRYASLEQKKKANEERLEKVNKKIAGMRLESDYVRRQHEWHEVAEEEKKIMTDDSDELIEDYNIAVKRGQTPRAKAIVQKLFKDGNGNDIIEASGWGANYKGMQNFGRKMQRDLHLAEDEMMSFMKDMGDIARHANQWAMAYSHITKYGKYVEASPEENFKKTLNMIRKAKPTLNASRFAFGYNDPAQGGKFNLHPAGLQYLLDDPRMLSFNIGRGMSAPNTLASIASNLEILKKFPSIWNAEIRDMGGMMVSEFFGNKTNYADTSQESFDALPALIEKIFGRM